MELIVTAKFLTGTDDDVLAKALQCQVKVAGNVSIITFEPSQLSKIARKIDDLLRPTSVELHDANTRITHFAKMRGPRKLAKRAWADVWVLAEEDSILIGEQIPPLSPMVVVEAASAKDAVALYRLIAAGKAAPDRHRHRYASAISSPGWGFLNASLRYGNLF